MSALFSFTIRTESLRISLMLVKSISGSSVNSIASFDSTLMLFTVYFSGGSRAENSPVTESVCMKM